MERILEPLAILCALLFLSLATSAQTADPVRLSLYTNATVVRLGEEMELTIEAKCLEFPSNTVFIFKDSYSVQFKVILPEGFVQTGGTYSENTSVLLSATSPKVLYTLKGKFTENTAQTEFTLLRRNPGVKEQSPYIAVARLGYAIKIAETNKVSHEEGSTFVLATPVLVPCMTMEDLRGGFADTTTKVVLVLHNGRVWTYRHDPSSTALDDSATVIRNGDRRYLIDLDRVTPQLFGAKGDGLADDTKAIQKAIDYVTYISRDKQVFLPAGNYKITNTIHLGYGVNYNGSPYVTVVLEGAAGGRAAQGTKIISTMRDRPAVSVTSGRQVRISNIQFVGDTYAQATAGLLFPTQVSGSNNRSMWRNPLWPTSASSETAPFAAIAVDPYCGAAPTVAYPDVHFPAFISGRAQYNKAPTSDLHVSDVVISGFEVGIVLSPSGANQQTDFIRLDRLWIEYCTFGVSVAHTDCREVSLKDSYLSSCHTGITTGAHGLKKGNWGGAIINTAFDRNIQWFDFSEPNYPRTGPIKFLNCYGENVWKLGNFGSVSLPGGSSRDTNMDFDHCSVKFQHADALGIPDYIVSATNRSYISFNGGFYAYYLGVFSIRATMGRVSFDNGVVFENNSVRTQDYERFADNAMAGGIVISNGASSGLRNKPRSFFVKHTAYDSVTKVIREMTYPVESSATRVPPVYANQVVGASVTSSDGMGLARPISTPFAYTIRTKSGFDALSLIDRDLTLTFPTSWTNINFMQRGGNPGDVIVDIESGSVFYVYNRTGYVVKAKLQNNYRIASSIYTYITPINVTASPKNSFLFINSRCYVPSTYTIGDLTTGSNIISNVGTEAGSADHIANEFPVGAAIMTDPETDNIVSMAGSNNVITAVNTSAKTITITGNSLKSEVKRRLGIMILPGPSNVD